MTKKRTYVVRPGIQAWLSKFDIYLDSKGRHSIVGAVRADQYTFFSVSPGTHHIYMNVDDWNDLEIQVNAGDAIFVNPNFLPEEGWELIRINREEGMYFVKHLKMGAFGSTKKTY